MRFVISHLTKRRGNDKIKKAEENKSQQKALAPKGRMLTFLNYFGNFSGKEYTVCM